RSDPGLDHHADGTGTGTACPAAGLSALLLPIRSAVGDAPGTGPSPALRHRADGGGDLAEPAGGGAAPRHSGRDRERAPVGPNAPPRCPAAAPARAALRGDHPIPG